MEYNLITPFKNNFTEEENTAIDEYINKTYEEHKDNTKALTQLAMQASSCVFAGKAKAREIANQNFLKNIWNDITGKNKKIRGDIDRDFAVSIDSCIKMISKLAEENKLTFDFITSVNVKLNNLVQGIDKEFNEVYSHISKMMQTTMSNLVRESTRIDKLERSMNVIHLESTIEYLDFEGTLYKDLEDNEKFLCIISDFFLATKGQYSINDLMMLKPIMSKVGINHDSKISMESLYRTILSNKRIAYKFFDSIDKSKMECIFDFEIPLLGNIKKINKLETDEKYIVDTISNMTKKDEKEVLFDLLKTYANNDLNMDLSKENSYFNLSVSIINELKNIDLIEIKEECEELFINNSVLVPMYEELGDTYFKLRDLEKAYNNYILAIENSLDNKNIYYKVCALIFYNFSHYATKNIFKFPIMEKFPIDVYCGSSDNSENLSKKISKLFGTQYLKSSINKFQSLIFWPFRIKFRTHISLPRTYKEDAYIYLTERPAEKIEVKGFSIDGETVENYIKKFLEFSKNSFYATLDCGVIYYVLKDYDKALDFFEKAIKIDNEKVEGFINKAFVLNTINKEINRELVEKSLNRAIGLDSNLSHKFKNNEGKFLEDLSKVLNLRTTFYQFLEKMGF